MKVKSLSHVRLFATPWTVARQAPLSMRFSRQECWSGLPFPSPGDLPDPGIEPGSPALESDALTYDPPGKPKSTIQFSSVTQACLTLCDPMTRSTPGLPVHHQLPEFTQTHIHRVHDAIQPSHPWSSLLLLPPIPPSITVFSSESTLRMRWPKYWSFSFSIILSKEISELIKTLQKMGTEGIYLNIVKAIYDKPTAMVRNWKHSP